MAKDIKLIWVGRQVNFGFSEATFLQGAGQGEAVICPVAQN
jgi:hypothetical protein